MTSPVFPPLTREHNEARIVRERTWTVAGWTLLVLGLLAVWMGRYDVTMGERDTTVILDRWTGKAEWCRGSLCVTMTRKAEERPLNS